MLLVILHILYMFLHDRALYEASHICHIYCATQYLYDHINSYTFYTRFIYDCSLWGDSQLNLAHGPETKK